MFLKILYLENLLVEVVFINTKANLSTIEMATASNWKHIAMLKAVK